MNTDNIQVAMQSIGELATDWAAQVSERMKVATDAINEAMNGVHNGS